MEVMKKFTLPEKVGGRDSPHLKFEISDLKYQI